MRDPWNPTVADLRAWAADPAPLQPEQDWDLAVATDGLAHEVLHLAADPHGAKRDFFLQVLYLIVGDAIRTQFKAHSRNVIDSLLVTAREYAVPEIELWVNRSKDLLSHPERFDYSLWCEGVLAKTPAQLP